MADGEINRVGLGFTALNDHDGGFFSTPALNVLNCQCPQHGPPVLVPGRLSLV